MLRGVNGRAVWRDVALKTYHGGAMAAPPSTRPGQVDLDAVRAAAARIAPYAHRTPVLTCRTLDRIAGRALFFKAEPLQRIGAFKFRGACNAVMKLSDEAAARGVVTHSSGNHAQALALAAHQEILLRYLLNALLPGEATGSGAHQGAGR